jgi:hypothetical protein
MREVLVYVAAAVVALWGVAHIIPTPNVVAGFEPTTADNRRVIIQEWVAEAFTMWATAAMLVVATVVGGTESAVTISIYRVAAGLLIALAVLTGLTGARTRVVWFKICPVLLACTAAVLITATLV